MNLGSFSLIGPGRAGLSLASALTERGWRLHHTYRRGDDVAQAARDVDAVVIAVPDDAIADVAAAIAPGSAVIIHLSGAKPLTVLGHHENRGSFHPLVSLPDPAIGARRLLDGATVAVAGHPLVIGMAESLGASSIEVAEDQRSLYHATAAIAANHLVVLCAQVEELAAELDIPVAIYWELMSSTLANVAENGALRSLTGPAARGDSETLAIHLASLPLHHRRLYETMAAAATQLSTRGADSLEGHHPAQGDDDDT